MKNADDAVAAFIEASAWHGSLEQANAILAAHPEAAAANIHTAAILGEDEMVRRFIERDPASATAKGGPFERDALTHLCFSRYLRLDPARTPGFVRAATALLDAGASANTGFYAESHLPKPEWEPVLYGAAGVAHHAALTRLLLERGANPNDEEVVYHSPETYDNAVLKLLVQTGKLTEDSLTMMLIRKHDWHDFEGVKFLLEQRFDVNRRWRHGLTPLHHAIARDNALPILELLLDRGADPASIGHGRSAMAMAARRGRGDLLEALARRGIPIALDGVDRLIAACATGDVEAVRSMATQQPELVREVVRDGGRLLAEFAGNGNTGGVRQLQDLGVNVAALFEEGDGYWDVARNSTALHVAAWRARHPTVKLLIERGAPVDARDGRGRTPLALAVRACVDSYWTERRSPESVDALLRAGASTAGIPVPSGYDEVDALLKGHSS